MQSVAEVASGTREVVSKLQRKAFSAIITRAQAKKLSASGGPTSVDAMAGDAAITWPPTVENRGPSPDTATGSSSTGLMSRYPDRCDFPHDDTQPSGCEQGQCNGSLVVPRPDPVH